MAAVTPELLHPVDPAEGTHRGAHSGRVSPADVHKVSPENVWIHHPIQESAYSLSTRFEVPLGGRTPRFVDLIEVQRQTGILQAHRQLGVPEGDVFTLDQIALTLVTRSPSSDVPRERGSIRAQIVATSARGRARSLSQYFSLEGNLGLIAIGRARASLIPRAVYERVREQARMSSVMNETPQQAGFSYEQHLHVDTSDPLLSDHPSDHLTAMQTIADVERVTRQLAPNAGLRSLKLLFQRYADADPSPILRLSVSATGRLTAEVVQLGVRRARVTGVLDLTEGVT